MGKQSFSIREDILSAAQRLKIGLAEIDEPSARKIRDNLVREYGIDQRYELTPSNMTGHSSVQHPDSWKWIGEFLSDEPVLLFYDSTAESCMFRLDSGTDVVSLLGECCGFVFCVTNESLSYVLCQNDHDYLIGAGAAKAWVGMLAPRHDEWARSLGTETGPVT
jgi:hypothetical protein